MLVFVLTFLAGILVGIATGMGIGEVVHGNPEMKAESDRIYSRLQAWKERQHADR